MLLFLKAFTTRFQARVGKRVVITGDLEQIDKDYFGQMCISDEFFPKA